AKVLDESVIDVDWHGTKLVSEFEQVTYRRGEQSPFEYLRRTSIANPHVKITFWEPDGKKTAWKRTVSNSPERPKEMKPHPLGVSADDLNRMSEASHAKSVTQFLQHDFSRVSVRRAREILKKAKLEDDKSPKKLTYQECQRVVAAFQKVKLLAPPTDGLIPIDEEFLDKSLKDTLNPAFFRVITRRPTTYRGGIPFQVEAAVAYGGGAGRKSDNGGRLEIMRFANKTPLLFDSGACAITRAIKSINWKNYNIGDIDNAPVTVLVNVLSPYVPYMSAGKQAISDDPDVVREVRFAVMEAARSVKKYMAGVRKEALRMKRRSIFARYAPEVAWAINKITGTKTDVVLERLMRTIEKRVGSYKDDLPEVKEEPEEKKSTKNN
ncbi:MAG: DNA topoisomerase VI subunit B, partial [Candidatus Altiarchaeota archaeon]|nr:DNA topoisomerase VI subunit B [Candidatus Altiarchaeota archaeon]